MGYFDEPEKRGDIEKGFWFKVVMCSVISFTIVLLLLNAFSHVGRYLW